MENIWRVSSEEEMVMDRRFRRPRKCFRIYKLIDPTGIDIPENRIYTSEKYAYKTIADSISRIKNDNDKAEKEGRVFDICYDEHSS